MSKKITIILKEILIKQLTMLGNRHISMTPVNNSVILIHNSQCTMFLHIWVWRHNWTCILHNVMN